MMLEEYKQKLFALMNKIKDINTQFARQNQLVYAKMYHPIKGKLISFKQFPYLVDIYEDTVQEIVVQKSSQCGISEYMIDEAFFLTENNKLVGLYCFPAQSQLNAFSHARVEQVIKQSPHLSELEGDTNNVSLREIGSSHIYFRGMQDIKQIISVDADYLMIDEVDAMRQDYIPIVEKRLGGSEHKIKRYVSTPTYPNYGINAKFKEGDQREWYVRCDECGYWQCLDFFKNVDFEKEIYVCKKCRKQINNLKNGKWIPRYKNREIHSYHISKLMSSRSSAKELIKSFKNKAALQHFYNFDLGKTYVVDGSRLTKENLDALVRSSKYDIQYSGERACMGVDVGADINIYITKVENCKPVTLFAGIVKTFEELDRYMNVYNVQMCVIDALPETRESKKFAARFPERVRIAYYPSMKLDLYYNKSVRDGVKIVDINRTLSLDYMYNDFFMQSIQLPKNIETVDNFYDQMTALIRVKELNKTGNKVARYVEQGADHYAHARNYCRVAENILGEFDADTMASFPSRRRDRIMGGSAKRVMK